MHAGQKFSDGSFADSEDATEDSESPRMLQAEGSKRYAGNTCWGYIVGRS